MSLDLDFLTEDLVESAKDRSFVPTSQTTFNDEHILRIANEEQLRVMAKIIKKREDFFYSNATTPLIAGKDHYLIPKGAAGNALVALFVVENSGDKRLLTRRDVSRIGEYSNAPGDSSSFYFQGDEIVLMRPPSDNTASLRFVYSRRPARLVLTPSCAKISSVSDDGTNVTFNVDTDLSASLNIGSKIDIIRSTSPFQLWAEEVVITAITASKIEVAMADVVDVAGNIEPGALDYICPSGYANIPMLPIEFHPILAERVACRMLRSLGDLAKWQAARTELKDMEDEALGLIKNRAEASPERPSRKNGLLRTFRG